MNTAAIFHRPMSEYAFALDETHYVFRLRAAKGDLKTCTFYYADRADMSPQLSFRSLPMQCVRSDKRYDWFEADLETPWLRIAYYFRVDDGNESLYYLGDCFETTDFQERSDFFQLPFNHRADRLQFPQWVNDAVVYNIFPDSFATGRRCISDQSSTYDYQGVACSSLHGGTIQGIRENLDYIKALGCNCVYLNPVFAARSYHKYDLLDYYHIDPARGTDEDFRALVQQAHAMGMRVIIDGVFNHISHEHPFFRDVLAKGSSSQYYDWFYHLGENPHYPQAGEEVGYTCFCYVAEMPKTDTANPAVRDYFCHVGRYWVREFGVDGWRLDVANEVDDRFLLAFRDAVKQENPEAIVIGEVWENAAHYINHQLLDSAMNYDFRRFCRQFFATDSIDAAEFDTRVSDLLYRFPSQAVFAQLNLLDSHDVSRFLTVCHGERDRMELALLFQMSFVGMPSIFYGDEKGLTGLSESEYRQPMDFSRHDFLEEIYRRFISLRKEHPALRSGKYRTVLAENRVYGYARSNPDETITIYLNAGEKTYPVPPAGEILLQKGFGCGLLKAHGYVVMIS